MKIRVHLFPTVIYSQSLQAATVEAAARDALASFNGNQVNFGQCIFADELTNLVAADPLDEHGQVVFSDTKKWTLNQVDELDTPSNIEPRRQVRVSLYPTVRYSRDVEASSVEEAAALVVGQFDGHVVDFGEASFADEVANLVILDPLNAKGQPIFSQSRQMTLEEVEDLMAQMQEDEPELAAPAM